MTNKLVLNVCSPIIIEEKSYTILSWNVNSYTLQIHDWLKEFVTINNPDVIFLSETKKSFDQLRVYFEEFSNYNYIINAHVPSHWHGVAMLINKSHRYQEFNIKMNIDRRSDSKSEEAAIGRIIVINLNEKVNIIGSYTPNSGQQDHIKLKYRTEVWDPCFFKILEILREIRNTIWIGDINVALDNIDVSNPKVMCKYAGFTPKERRNFSNLLSTGNWIDIWRLQHPKETLYTWVGNPRRPNYGLRLDNIIISRPLINKEINTFAINETPISDHIMIGVTIHI